MKKIAHLFFLVMFSAPWFIPGGMRISYPVLERILANIERAHTPDEAALIRSHTNASNMCGVRAVVHQNADAITGISNGVASFVHVLLPISQFHLAPVFFADPSKLPLRSLHGELVTTIHLQPPRLLV
jgi:hypothetical protein